MWISPESSFLNLFTSEGRLKLQWQQALAEANVYIRLAKLRLVQQQLLANEAKFVHLWLPFLDSFLSPTHFMALTKADIKEVEGMGDFLSEASLEDCHPEEIWRRAIHVYRSTDADNQAYALLTRMFYRAEVKSEWRDWAAWQLAESNACANEHLDVYIQYLQSSSAQAYAKQMLTILAKACNVNFDSDYACIERAKELATRLIANGIDASGKWKANAFYALLVKRKPRDAIELFMQALTNNEGDNDTLCGLVVASIQCDCFEYATEITQAAKKFTSPIIVGLLTLFSALQWLNNQSNDKYSPSTAKDIELLKGIGLQTYVGDKLDFVIGRLYLLEGNAHKAANILRPVVAKHLEHPQWKYYVIWADLLINDNANLAHNFASSTTWSGNWTIASLVLDAEPTIAEQHLATSQLKRAVNTKHPYAHYIKARLALIHMHVSEAVAWVMHDGSLEENMEALRIALASAFYRRNTQLLAKLIELPLFYRLPFPDQDLWRGLCHFSTKNNAQGRALLADSYKKFGYRRVALVLAVHYLEYDMLQEAKRFLNQVGTGKDNSKVALLRAYVEEREGDVQRAVATYKTLLKQGEARAHYALGNYYLHQAKYSQAVEEFNNGLNEKNSTLPNDCAVIALCASFVINPKPVNLWYELESLEPSQRQTWLWWNAFLARLWYGSASDAVATCDLIMPMLEYLGVERDTIALEITRALVRICFKVADIEQENKLTPVLESISRLINSSSVTHTCQIGITILAQKRYQKLSKTNHLVRKDHSDSVSKVNSTNGSLALLFASISIASNQQNQAIELLKNVVSPDEYEQKLCQTIASILEEQTQACVNVTPIHLNISPKTKIGYDLLNIIIAFMTDHIAEGSKKLFDAFCKDAETTTAIFDMKHVVLYCCALVAQERTSAPKLIELLHNLANEVQEGEDIASIARCFTLLDETEHALSTWKRLNHKVSVTKQLWGQEVAQLLYYVAAKDYDNVKTVQTLREATYWVSRTEQGKLCNRLANSLERQHAAYNLLTMMFPAMDEARKTSGRYAYLVEVIGQHPQLKEVLVRNGRSVRHEWRKVVTQSLKHDIRLLHFRAVGYRDYVLDQSNKSHEMGDWIKYTLLWVLMLCSEEFWTCFSADRSISESEERVPLDEIDQDALFYNAIDHIFSLHSSRASQAFVANNYQIAKTHFLCLDLCQRGEQTLLLEVEEQKMKWSLSLYSKRMNWAQARADKILKEWTDNLVREAKKATENVEALRNLHVSKDYEMGIRILEPFIGLDIPVLRVLTTCLQWYNDWCNDLISIKEYSQIPSMLSSANNIAIKLMTLCTQEEGYRRENQVLAEYFCWQGLSSYYKDKEQCADYYQQALVWNPANTIAQKWLKDLEDENLDDEDEEEEGYVLF